ncbi:MAG: hypothetical protein AVDCRST_MAG83-3477, partial [uncultured Arthrobacter sp.]
WAAPVSADTTRLAPATSAAKRSSGTSPATTAGSGSPAASATASARARSPALPVSRTWWPAPASALETAAKRSTGHSRLPYAAPTCTTTAPGAELSSSGMRRRRSSGSAGTPCQETRPAHRCRSWTPSCQGGPSHPGERWPMRRAGAISSSRPRLSGPLPWRLTAMSMLPGARSRGSSSPCVGSSSSTASVSATIGASQAWAAYRMRCPGNARRSPRSAGTATRRSPSFRARRASSSGRPSGCGDAARFDAMAPSLQRKRAQGRALPAAGRKEVCLQVF